ncbi:MAG TPA: NAD(P)-binding domain-containing protein [Thermoplasmata archaeon]|nr:NAD(P)-binding domain-containing protein [Thermoplasmata archaeon]
MSAAKRAGILGSGDVAKVLGRGFAKHGYEVMLGTREPKKLDGWKREAGPRASVGSFGDAARFGDPVILATNGAATEAAIELAGPPTFAGKLVLDATNPLDFSHGMPPGLFLGTTDSLGERVQKRLSSAHVVKCFNTVGNVRFIDPKFAAGPVKMLICGNDAAAKKRTEEILKELGWAGALDVGGIDGARWLEALVPLWVRAGATLNAWDHAFQVIR